MAEVVVQDNSVKEVKPQAEKTLIPRRRVKKPTTPTVNPTYELLFKLGELSAALNTQKVYDDLAKSFDAKVIDGLKSALKALVK